MTLKTTKVVYWVSTGLLALFILPGIFFMNSPIAQEGIRHMQIPAWLGTTVGIGQFIGGLILIIPKLPIRLKEWGYTALGIVYMSAFIGHIVLDGFGRDTITAMVMFAVLVISYLSYHKVYGYDRDVTV
ncbi:MAG: DoxX family protein [Bacteroidota bacterium]